MHTFDRQLLYVVFHDWRESVLMELLTKAGEAAAHYLCRFHKMKENLIREAETRRKVEKQMEESLDALGSRFNESSRLEMSESRVSKLTESNETMRLRLHFLEQEIYRCHCELASQQTDLSKQITSTCIPDSRAFNARNSASNARLREEGLVRVARTRIEDLRDQEESEINRDEEKIHVSEGIPQNPL